MEGFHPHSLIWIIVISFITMPFIVDAPKLHSFKPPTVCVGQTLTLRWGFKFPDKAVGYATWTFKEHLYDSPEIILATYYPANKTFVIDPEAETYKNRISHLIQSGLPAAIQISNVSESDEGMYGIYIKLEKPLSPDQKDFVNISILNPNSSIILPVNNTICSNEFQSTSLSWTLRNSVDNRLPLCDTAIGYEWSKDGVIIATMERSTGILMVMQGVGFDDRLQGGVKSNGSSSYILIYQTLAEDAGKYNMTAKYSDQLSIKSDEIVLQVTTESEIQLIADIKQCLGSDVVFVWNFTEGMDCGRPRIVSKIIWNKQEVKGKEVKIAEWNKGSFISRRVGVKQFNSSITGIILQQVNDSNSGVYDIVITFKAKGHSPNDATSSTNLSLEEPEIPAIDSPDSGKIVEKCEGDEVVLSWTFHFPQPPNSCDKVTVVGRHWYLNDTLIFSQYGDRTTTTKKSSTSPNPALTEPTKNGNTLVNTDTQKTDEIITSNPSNLTTTTEPSSTSPNPELTEPTQNENTLENTDTQKSDEIINSKPTILPEQTSFIDTSSTSKADTNQEVQRRRDIPRTRSDTFSFSGTSDAGLAIHGVKMEHSGSYYVNVSFRDVVGKIVPIVSTNYTMLKVTKATAISVTDDKKSSLCTDEFLSLTWKLQEYGCNTPFKTSWYFRSVNQTEQKIGSMGYGSYWVWMKAYARRIKASSNTSLTIKDLQTNDSGTYIMKLTYSDNVTFQESPINVTIYDANSGECMGSKYERYDILLTRNGKDVRLQTNRTVFINDTVALSVNIQDGKGLRYTRFFWMETHHKMLRQFFGKWCRQAGNCTIQWKVSKRLPGIIFRPKEYRREVQLGVKYFFMQEKTLIRNISFYLRNYKDVTLSSRSLKTKSKDKSSQGTSGVVRQCTLSQLIFLITAMSWISFLHQQKP